MADDGNSEGSEGIDPSSVAAVLRARAAEGIALPVKGSSMGRSVSSGGLVQVVVSRSPRRGEVWCYVDALGSPVVHRVRAVRDGQVVFRGDANRSNDRPVPIDRLVGRVVRTDSGRRFGRLDRWGSVTSQAAGGLARRLSRAFGSWRSPEPPG